MTVAEQREKLYNDVIKKSEELGYQILSPKEDFINNQSIIKYICPIHGELERRCTSLRQGKKCPLCANKDKIKKALEAREANKRDYYQMAREKCDENNYKLISKTIKYYNSMIEYICPCHGLQNIRFYNLINGEKCILCRREEAQKRNSLSKEEVIQRVETVGGQLINPDDYVNNQEKNLLIKCPRCKNNILRTSLSHFLQHGGQFCQDCYRKESSGERLIRGWLEKNDIYYIPQKKFAECKDKNCLPFDFYLPDHNKIIEFDGEQHYKEQHYFNREVDGGMLKYIQNHDKIKDEFCKNNNIPILRIRYNQMNKIGDILSQFIYV